MRGLRLVRWYRWTSAKRLQICRHGGHLLIRAEQAEGLGWRWPQAGPVLNASVELSGGDLPQVLMSLRQPAPGAPWA